jgi:hypothetical protein
MNDESERTRKILRRSKVTTDERGRTVWDETIKTAKLELVSTQMLKHLLETNDSGTQDQLREVAKGADGVLARDVNKGGFEVISDEELQHILNGTDPGSTKNPAAATTGESAAKANLDEPELDLVSTQLLRTILDPEDEEPAAESGFNPYDHS